METTNTIEVNGKRYDATTGAVIAAPSAPPLRSSGRNIDGFFRPRATTTPRTDAPVSITVQTVAPSAPEMHIRSAVKKTVSRAVNHTKAHAPQAAHMRVIAIDHPRTQSEELPVHRGRPNHMHHHAVQHSQTLRRDAVPSPAQSTHNQLRPASVLHHAQPTPITVKNAAVAIDADRLARAQTTPRSTFVARHAAPTPSVLPTFAPVAVQPGPAPAAPPAIPAPTPTNDGVPPAPAPQQDKNPVDIFEHALANANNFVDLHAHKAQYRKKARTHVASMLTGSVALMLVATFIAYQNSPAMQLRFASTEAGISTHMPNFAAAGFTFDGVHGGNSRLTFGFTGNKGNYQMTQTNTNLSDNDMIQTVGSTTASGDPTYQVVQAGDTTVYRFNNTNATWVSNGKWYTVSGNSALSDQQVKSIVQHA